LLEVEERSGARSKPSGTISAPKNATEVFAKGHRLQPRSVRMMLGLGAAQYAQRFKEDASRTRNTSATKSGNWSIRCGTKAHLLKRAHRPVLPADIRAAFSIAIASLLLAGRRSEKSALPRRPKKQPTRQNASGSA
jgi:hypothetical protein